MVFFKTSNNNLLWCGSTDILFVMLLYLQVETILQLVGSAALVQFASKKLLFAEVSMFFYAGWIYFVYYRQLYDLESWLSVSYDSNPDLIRTQTKSICILV